MWMYEEEMFHLDSDDGGGADGSSDDGEGSDEGEGEGEGDGETDAEGKPVKKGEGPKPGSKRWNKIYAGHKLSEQYQVYGTPADVAHKMARLDVIEEKIARKEEEGKDDTKEVKDLKEKHATIRKQMREIEPNLEHLEAIHDHLTEVKESLKTRAADATIEVMEEHGFEVGEESFGFFAKALDNIIDADRRLYLVYLTNPEKAIAQAYETYAKPFQAEGERKKGAALVKEGAALKRLPKTVKQGSSSAPIKKHKEAQDTKEAEKMFAEQFEALQED